MAPLNTAQTISQSKQISSQTTSEQQRPWSNSGFGTDCAVFPSGSKGQLDVQLSNDKNEFIVTIDTGDNFKPDELTVSSYGNNVLKIEGKHVQDDGSSYVSKQFSRSYTLPSDCKSSQMTSSFASGKLSIRVPKLQPQAHVQWADKREVPIQVNRKESNEMELNRTRSCRIEPTTRKEPHVREVRINRSNGTNNDGSWTLGSRTPFVNNFMEPVQLFNHQDVFENGMNSADLQHDRKFFSMEKPGETVETSETDEKFTFSLDTQGYEPRDIKVTVLDDVLKIEGKHMSDSEDGGNRKSTSRQFVRSYVLPRSVYNMSRVESSLTKAGKLVVTVPKLEPIRHDSREINVPIKMIRY